MNAMRLLQTLIFNMSPLTRNILKDVRRVYPDGSGSEFLARFLEQVRMLEIELDRQRAESSNLIQGRQQAEGKLRELVEYLERCMFEAGKPQQGAQIAANMLITGQPVQKAIEELIRHDAALVGSRHFRAFAPALAPQRSLPSMLDGELRRKLRGFQIVDIGSQMLEFEDDIYAPLARRWPCEIVGFDPFTPGSAPRGVEVVRPDGRRIRTLPHLVGDGHEARFHINRMSATSSTLPANHVLTRQFGLLDDCVETVESQIMPTRRLDDLLDEGVLFDGTIDFLKIDVQGAAQALLENASKTLGRCLVLHVEAEFAQVYEGQSQFSAVDRLLREAGFGFVDFYALGRMPYGVFDANRDKLFHSGRLLWGDAIYIYGLDSSDALTGDNLLRTALVMHEIYNKQDVAAELLSRYDRAQGTHFAERYVL